MEILPCKDFNVDELRFGKYDPENGDSNDNFYIIKPHYKNPLIETGELPHCTQTEFGYKHNGAISIPYFHDNLVCQELFNTLLKIDDKNKE